MVILAIRNFCFKISKESVFSGPAISPLKLPSRRGVHIEATGCPHQLEVRSTKSSQFPNQTFDSFKMQRDPLDQLEPLLQRRDNKKEGRLDFSWALPDLQNQDGDFEL